METLQALVTLCAFVVWTWTIVWAAGSLRTELRHLREDLNELKTAVRQGSSIFSSTLIDHGERISRIEGRYGDDGV